MAPTPTTPSPTFDFLRLGRVLWAGLDRVLLVSYKPEPMRAADQLAGALVRGLSKLGDRQGALVAQLDELVLGSADIVAHIPYLPPEPVALALTGTPSLVAAAHRALLRATTGRFATLRGAPYLSALRVGLAAVDGAVVVDVNRELGGERPGVLSKAGWAVAEAGGEDEEAGQLLFEAGFMLGAFEDRPSVPEPPLAPARPGLQALDHLARRMRRKRRVR